jgi:hypothetical protein
MVDSSGLFPAFFASHSFSNTINLFKVSSSSLMTGIYSVLSIRSWHFFINPKLHVKNICEKRFFPLIKLGETNPKREGVSVSVDSIYFWFRRAANRP